MSQENVEVVRRHVGPYDGRDLALVVGEMNPDIDLDDPEAVRAAMIAMVSEDPAWRDVDSEVVWDATGLGVSSVARGVNEVAAYWQDWAGAWETYIFQVIEYRDLGDWVLTVTDVRARGRDGIDLALRSFQAWEVREGRIATMRAYTSEADALAPIEAGE